MSESATSTVSMSAASIPAGPMPAVGRAIDADNHYYEPYDAFTRHIDPKFRDRAVNVRKDDKGLGRLFYGDQPLQFMRVTPTDYVGAPGSSRNFFDGNEDGWAQREVINAHDHAAFMNRESRLALLDEQKLDSCLIFPTLAVAVEHELQTDVEAYYANVEAFNRWVEEDWGFGDDGRIYAAALGSVLDLELGCRELDRVLNNGAKIIHLKTGPAGGFSPGDPRFDPFWARINEARASVAFHIGQSGYNGLVSTIWGEPAFPPLQAISPFQWYLGYDERPIMDTLANLVLFNLFGRFPDIKVMSIEFGSGWVTPLLHSIDHSVRMARRGRWPGGRFDDKPSDVFRNHVFVAPYPEDDVLGLIDVIGADQVLFGSDFPHSEGLVQPTDFADKLAGAPRDVIDKVMYGNAAGLLARVV